MIYESKPKDIFSLITFNIRSLFLKKLKALYVKKLIDEIAKTSSGNLAQVIRDAFGELWNLEISKSYSKFSGWTFLVTLQLHSSSQATANYSIIEVYKSTISPSQKFHCFEFLPGDWLSFTETIHNQLTFR